MSILATRTIHFVLTMPISPAPQLVSSHPCFEIRSSNSISRIHLRFMTRTWLSAALLHSLTRMFSPPCRLLRLLTCRSSAAISALIAPQIAHPLYLSCHCVNCLIHPMQKMHPACFCGSHLAWTTFPRLFFLPCFAHRRPAEQSVPHQYPGKCTLCCPMGDLT